MPTTALDACYIATIFAAAILFFIVTAATEIYTDVHTLALPDALPISRRAAVRAPGVARPQAGGQAIGCRIGDRDRLFHAIERDDRGDGPENFFLRDPHVDRKSVV